MLAIIAAMQKEADAVLCKSTVKKSCTLCGKKIYYAELGGRDFNLIVCGIGKVNAAAGTQLAIDRLNADILLNLGVAGGISKNLKIGQLFSIVRAAQYDFDLSEVNNTSVGTLDEYTEPYLPCNRLASYPAASLATGDRFNDSSSDLKLLTEFLQADIRDMEGAAIAQVALAAGVPLYMVKSISDVVGSDCVQQYRDNLARALGTLSSAAPDIVREVK